MDPEKKLRTRIYGAGNIYHIAKSADWSKHSRATARRMLRALKRKAKAWFTRRENTDGDE
jgi:hypothetical protein